MAYLISSFTVGTQWNISVSDSDMSVKGGGKIVSDDTFTINYPTIMVTRKNVGIMKWAAANFLSTLKNSSGTTLWSVPQRAPSNIASYTWTDNLTQNTPVQIYRRSDVSNAYKTFQTSTYFNANNKTSKSVNLTWTVQLQAGYYTSESNNGLKTQGLYYTDSTSASTRTTLGLNSETKTITWSVPVMLDAPPTFTSTNVSFNESYHVAGHTKASVTISNLSAKYGGTIKSVVLKIGNQTASGTGNGTLSINCSTAGTYTPEVTVTDSRGQTRTQKLASITINSHTAPTFTASNVTFNESYHVAGHTTASTQISSLSLKNGTTLRSMVFKIGNQTKTGTGNGPLSINCDTANTFTPEVTVTDSWGGTTTKKLANITVNSHTAPTFNASDVTFNESYHVAGHTTASTNITNLSLKNGTTLSSIVFKIGNQTKTGTPLSINCSTAGTFSPTVTVTDSWGGTTTKKLSNIVINSHTAPTVTSTGVTFVDSEYAEFGKAKVTISQATTYQGASIATNGITLKIGSQTASISSTGDIVTPILTTAGEFTPTVTIVDSWGGTYTTRLADIIVKQYKPPLIASTAEVERTDENGVESDEGPNAVASVPITYTYEVATLEEPEVIATKIDGTEVSGLNITWYKDRGNRGLQTPISDWTTINNNTTIYAFITDSDSDNINTPFDTQQSYNIIITPKDTTERSSVSSNLILGAAYYTIDILGGESGIGGHGIAFGQPCAEIGFWCGMEAHFVDDVYIELDTTDSLYTAINNLGWVSAVIE